MDAYEIFLEEQRNLKKAEDALKKVTEEPIERNMFGLPRHMSMPRIKREVEGKTIHTACRKKTVLQSQLFLITQQQTLVQQ